MKKLNNLATYDSLDSTFLNTDKSYPWMSVVTASYKQENLWGNINKTKTKTKEQEHIPSPVTSSPSVKLCFGTSIDFIIFLNCSNSLRNWGCNWSFFVLRFPSTFWSVEGGDRANASKPGKKLKIPLATSSPFFLLLRGACSRKTCVNKVIRNYLVALFLYSKPSPLHNLRPSQTAFWPSHGL